MFGLSHAAVGELIGKSRISVINWEKGKGSPNVHDIDKLSNALGISQYFFWTE